ncbi:MAG: DUF2195 family protein [Smithellaceae bacterium]
MVGLKNNRILPVFILLTIALLLSCSKADSDAQLQNIRFENSVQDCLEISPLRAVQENNLFFVHAKLTAKKNIGYCGCTSLLLSYQVVDKIKNLISYGVFSSVNRDHLTLLINSDVEKNDVKPLTVWIGCKSPD